MSSTPFSRHPFREICLLLLLPLLPTRGTAQEQAPAEMIREFAESASGFTLWEEVETGTLRAEGQAAFPVTLTEGMDYMVVGYCDQNCEDMDLALLDGSGSELETDYLADAQPILIHTADSSGTYSVRIDMVGCSTEPCGYAVGVLEGGVAVGFGAPGESIADYLVIFREEISAQGFTELGSPEGGNLGSDQEIRFSMELMAGVEYKIAGVCDSDCMDMDLVLYDPSGNEVTSDLLPDAFPLLSTTPVTSGSYRIAAVMVDCSLEPCGFQVATFVKGEGIGPGGVAISGTIVADATHRGTLEAGDVQLTEGEYFDQYSVEARAGQRIIVDLRSPDFDTYLILEAPGGEAERNDDYDEDTMHSHVEMVAPEDGSYAITVTTFSAGSIGDYVVRVVVVDEG